MNCLTCHDTGRVPTSPTSFIQCPVCTPACDFTPLAYSAPMKCSRCKNAGWIEGPASTGPVKVPTRETCPDCLGASPSWDTAKPAPPETPAPPTNGFLRLRILKDTLLLLERGAATLPTLIEYLEKNVRFQQAEILPRIMIDPTGTAYVNGTGIHVTEILERMAKGESGDDIRTSLPDLEPEDIRQALAYVANVHRAATQQLNFEFLHKKGGA